VTLTNVSASTLNTSTGITTGSLRAIGTSVLANATVTNISTGGLNASTGITTASLRATGTSSLANVTATNVSSGTGIFSNTVTVNGVMSVNSNDARYHLYNNAAVAEWKFGQKSTSRNDFSFTKVVAGTETDYLTINHTGNVGINNTSPAYTLDVAGSLRAQVVGAQAHVFGSNYGTNHSIRAVSSIGSVEIGVSAGNGSFVSTTANSGDAFLRSATGKGLVLTGNEGTGAYVYVTNAGVGINTVTPSFPLDVSGNVSSTVSGTFVNGFSASVGSISNYNGTFSARFSHRIQASEIFLTSDNRIKTNIEDVTDSSALILLRQLQPKTYNYIDKLQRGPNTVYGFIAQEVKEVLPPAITLATNTIPSVYGVATLSVDNNATQILTMIDDRQNPFAFDVGAKLKLYKENNESIYVTVKTIIDNKSFSINETLELESTKVFVYGHEVDDFHTVNKDYIWTVATAALQEVDRQLQAEKDEHQETRSRLEALEQRIANAGL